MKRILLLIITIMLVLTGCTQVNPTIGNVEKLIRTKGWLNVNKVIDTLEYDKNTTKLLVRTHKTEGSIQEVFNKVNPHKSVETLNELFLVAFIKSSSGTQGARGAINKEYRNSNLLKSALHQDILRVSNVKVEDIKRTFDNWISIIIIGTVDNKLVEKEIEFRLLDY